MMKSMKWLRKIDWILMIELAAVCIIVIPILIVSFYAIPSADDFGNSVTIRKSLLQHSSYFGAALSEVIWYYKNISGYFFGAFLDFYISPLLRGGITALRWTVFFCNLFFYSSLYFLIDELLRFFYEIRDKRVSLLTYILMLFAFVNNEYNSEMITWYCALIGYVAVVACMFWGVIFFLKALQSNRKTYVILSSSLGFLVSGGSLNVTALNCGIYLLIAYVGGWVYRKKMTAIICFASALAGGIINVIAPGNYLRHSTDSYPVLSALSLANYHEMQQLQKLLFGSPFIMLLCIFFILCLKSIHHPRAVNSGYLILFAGVIYLGIIAVNFPVCLGYIVSYFPERCVWVENCVIYFGSFSWVACLAEWLKSKYADLEIRKDTLVCIFISLVLYGCNFSATRDISDYPTIKMIQQLVSGKIADYTRFWENILEEIEHSKEDEVIIYRDEIWIHEFVLWPDITSDKDHYTNQWVADYYGKNSVFMTTESEGGI